MARNTADGSRIGNGVCAFTGFTKGSRLEHPADDYLRPKKSIRGQPVGEGVGLSDDKRPDTLRRVVRY